MLPLVSAAARCQLIACCRIVARLLLTSCVTLLRYNDYARPFPNTERLLTAGAHRGLMTFAGLKTCKYHSKGRCLEGVHNDSVRADFVLRFKTAIEKSVDLVLCQFPGFQCSLFAEMRVGIAVRFVHRYDHHAYALGSTVKHAWDELLERWHSTGRAAIFVDNPFDLHYLCYYRRIAAVPWFVSAMYVAGANEALLPRASAVAKPRANTNDGVETVAAAV